MYLLFGDIKQKDKTKAVESLMLASAPKPSFFFLVVLSVLMATCGLLLNNGAVIIGSMLIAPILSPILSLALGITLSDPEIVKKSMQTLIKAVAYSVAISAIITWVLWNINGNGFTDAYNVEILSRTEPNIVYLFIAIIAGLATAFVKVKSDLSDALPGTAIAVALVPPLATIGIGVATFDLSIVSGSLLMFILNAIGIVLAAMVMFLFMNMHNTGKIAKKTLKKVETEQEHITEKFKKEQAKK
jgi:uncharacterized hydrophobic protein (TIGR00271 family)